MLYYIYITVAVVVAIGIGVVGVMLIRKGHRVAEEEFYFYRPTNSGAILHPAAATASRSHGQPVGNLKVENTRSEWTELETGAPPKTEGDQAGVDSLHRSAAEGQPEARDRLPSQPVPPHDEPVRPQPEPVAHVATEQPGDGIGRTEPAYGSGVAADPLGMVILSMVDGNGRLTPAELKRLEVFRPERVDLAVQTIQLPPRLQADEDAALRLAQIQLYAATLELRAKWSAQAARLGEDTDVPFSPRDFKLKIARDVLSLPAPDRAEVIGYLLGGLLNLPGTVVELKRAVIDTLEQLKSIALTNVLLDCLDDPDPIVQEYALAAAERLLDG